MTLEEMKQFIKENLKLSTVSRQEYQGCNGDGGDMWKEYHTITLDFCDEVLSEITV